MKVRAWRGISVHGDCLRLDVTWSGTSYTRRSANIFLKLSDRLSNKLEGFTGKI